jgi:hypothetical protein
MPARLSTSWYYSGMALQVPKYAWKDHWRVLRRSQSVKWIGYTFFAVNGTLAFVRGAGIYLDDLKKVAAWISLDWFLGILCLTLTALLIAVFNETKNIVQAKMVEHHGEISTLKQAHTDALTGLETANANALLQAEADQQKQKVAYDQRIKTLETQLEGMRDKRPKVRMDYSGLNEFWLQNYGNSDAYELGVYVLHAEHSVTWSIPVSGCLCPGPDKKKPVLYTIDGSNKNIETLFDATQEPLLIHIGYRDGQQNRWNTTCRLGHDPISHTLQVTCGDPELLPPMPQFDRGSY